jgi:hypothetical protein
MGLLTQVHARTCPVVCVELIAGGCCSREGGKGKRLIICFEALLPACTQLALLTSPTLCGTSLNLPKSRQLGLPDPHQRTPRARTIGDAGTK